MPMAWVAVEQALQVAKVGPLTPYSMPTWADAEQRQRVGRALVVKEEVAIGVFEGGEAAGARADDAGRAIGVLERCRQARLGDRFLGCRGGKPGIAVGVHDDFVALVVLEADLGVEALDLRPDLDLEILERKVLERADAGFTSMDAGP
jgi:hypothetical protein